jgi:hypothetical protein
MTYPILPTIGATSIEEMESRTIATTTTIKTGDFETLSTLSLKQPIWNSETGLPSSYTSINDTDSNSDTESSYSFFSTCSSPNAGADLEACSPLSSIFEDDCTDNNADEKFPSPGQLSLVPSPKPDTTSEVDDTFSGHSSQPSSPSTQSNHQTSPSLSCANYFSRLSESQHRHYKATSEVSCLQCNILGLRCSFTPKYTPNRAPRPYSPACTRCERNGEKFCIQQVLSDGRGDAVGEYWAVGIDSHLVRSRVGELLEGESAKMRFALPIASAEARLGLRRTFRRMEEEEDNWSMDWS